MPFGVAFSEPATFLVKASGEVTLEEWVDAIDRIASMQQLRPGAQLLIDARDVTGLPGTNEIRTGANATARLRDKGLDAMAIVADRPFVYGSARMFASFAGMVNVNVNAFRCEEEARAWLHTQRSFAA